jgi:hypothetical protein
MPRYVYRPNDPRSDKNGMIDVMLAGPRHAGGAAAYVISDEMDATRHMGNNKMYTSKAKFRQATKDAGCIEVGNETDTLLKQRKPMPLSREQRRNDIRQALRELRGR